MILPVATKQKAMGITNEDPVLQAQVVASMMTPGVSALVISPADGQEEATFGTLARAGVPAIGVLSKVDQLLELFPFFP